LVNGQHSRSWRRTMATPFSPFDRRTFMKWGVALPLLGRIAAQDLFGKVQGAIGKPSAENVYRRLGVRTIINCRGTWTYLSGSLELPGVRAAQLEAAKHFVDRSEEHTSELQSRRDLVCRLLLEKKKKQELHAYI